MSCYPRGSKLSLFSIYEQCFSRYRPFFKIAIFGHQTWPLAKVPEVAHIPSFYTKGLKLSLVSLYGQQFPRYRAIFKIAIFGHEAWTLAKVPEVAHIFPKLPTKSKFHLRLPISKILAIFHFPIGHNVKFHFFCLNSI